MSFVKDHAYYASSRYMSSPKTEKREMDSIVECAGELKCDNLVIVTYNDKRTIEKDGYRIDVVPITEF